MSGSLTVPTETEITVAQFRTTLPSFADSSVYLDESVTMWLNLAATMLDPVRWGSLLQLGLSLFAAHQLTLERMSVLAAQRGGIGGGSFGLTASKAIDGVSVSYDTALVGIPGAGDWNLTLFGVRFMTMARMMGMGGLQLSPLFECQQSAASYPNGSIGPLGA